MSKITDNQLYLKDWEVTKDRIKHFDEIVIKIRVQAIPIGSAFIAFGWGLHAEGYIWSYWIFLFAAIYIIPVGMLDWLHYRLLHLSVQHAIYLENEKFNRKIQITNKLTSKTLTLVHTTAAAIVYIIIFLTAILSFCIIKGYIVLD